MKVTVVGAGVAGLVTGIELAERGAEVTLLERSAAIGSGACSWSAGGMLAPWCERESAEQAVLDHGRVGLAWWPRHFAGTVLRGTLVVAPARDSAELDRFARKTRAYAWLDEDGVATLEPDLGGRFRKGLFFADEGHLDPRAGLVALAAQLLERGADIRLETEVQSVSEVQGDAVVDCRGFAARSAIAGLRGVRGEMIVVRSAEVAITRPIRFLHPRIPLYIVPRGDGRFMIGATMIESDHRGPMTVRSALELLNAAYALHPAFVEAEILEMGADVRPAFPDNLPRVTNAGRVTTLNGLFRHGFLLSPAFAKRAADLVFSPSPSAA